MVYFNQQIKEDIKMYNPFDDYKIIKEWFSYNEGNLPKSTKEEFAQALHRYADWVDGLKD